MYYKRQYRFQFSKTLQTFEDIYTYHTGTSFPLEGSEKCKFNFFRVLVHHSTQYICYISTEPTGDQKSFQFRIMRFSCSHRVLLVYFEYSDIAGLLP